MSTTPVTFTITGLLTTAQDNANKLAKEQAQNLKDVNALKSAVGTVATTTVTDLASSVTGTSAADLGITDQATNGVTITYAIKSHDDNKGELTVEATFAKGTGTALQTTTSTIVISGFTVAFDATTARANAIKELNRYISTLATKVTGSAQTEKAITSTHESNINAANNQPSIDTALANAKTAISAARKADNAANAPVVVTGPTDAQKVATDKALFTSTTKTITGTPALIAVAATNAQTLDALTGHGPTAAVTSGVTRTFKVTATDINAGTATIEVKFKAGSITDTITYTITGFIRLSTLTQGEADSFINDDGTIKPDDPAAKHVIVTLKGNLPTQGTTGTATFTVTPMTG